MITDSYNIDMQYTYKINSLNYDTLLKFLEKINSDFSPSLSEQVSLDVYASKIINNAMIFEIWDKEKLISYVCAYVNDAKTQKAFVTSVYCDKNYRNKGLPSYLLNKLNEICKTKNFKTIALECYKDNIKAFNLYSKLGFHTEVSDDKKFYMVKQVI